MCLASLKYLNGNWPKISRVRAYSTGYVPRSFSSYFGNKPAQTEEFERVKQEQFAADGEGIVYMVHRLKKIPVETERMDDVFYNRIARRTFTTGQNTKDTKNIANDRANDKTQQYNASGIRRSACELERRDFNYLYRKQRCY